MHIRTVDEPNFKDLMSALAELKQVIESLKDLEKAA